MPEENNDAIELEIRSLQCTSLAQDLANTLYALSYERARNSVITRLLNEKKDATDSEEDNADDARDCEK